MTSLQDQLVRFSFVPAFVSAGGVKLPADLTASHVITTTCFCQRVLGEQYDKLVSAMPAAEGRFVQV